MTAVIYIDPDAFRPVIDGKWHRGRLTGTSEAGQHVTMLCGKTAAVAFEPLSQRRARGIPQICTDCDVIYRQEHGIPLQQDRLRR